MLEDGSEGVELTVRARLSSAFPKLASIRRRVLPRLGVAEADSLLTWFEE